MPDYKLKIRRFDPESGQSAYWSEYDVEVESERSVLKGILTARDDQDGSIGIRCSCQAAICGSCAVRINGKTALACNTAIGEAQAKAGPGNPIVVEPMNNMPVIKDLIVDMDAVHWKKVQRVIPWLLPEGAPPEREYIVPAESMIDITNDFGIKDRNNGYGHEKAFVNILEKWGTLHEAQLLPRSFGDGSLIKGQIEPTAVKQLIQSLPTAVGGLKSGKVSPVKALWHHKLPGQENVKRIFEEIESKDERLELNLYIVEEEPGEEQGAMAEGSQES